MTTTLHWRVWLGAASCSLALTACESMPEVVGAVLTEVVAAQQTPPQGAAASTAAQRTVPAPAAVSTQTLATPLPLGRYKSLTGGGDASEYNFAKSGAVTVKINFHGDVSTFKGTWKQSGAQITVAYKAGTTTHREVFVQRQENPVEWAEDCKQFPAGLAPVGQSHDFQFALWHARYHTANFDTPCLQRR